MRLVSQSYQGRILGTANLLFPLAPLSCLSVHRSPLGILPFLAVLSVEPENIVPMSSSREPGDWPCHADYLLTARTYLQHGLPTTGASAHHQPLPQPGTPGAGYYCSLLAQARGHPAGVAGHQPAAATGLQGWLAQQARTGSGCAPSSASARQSEAGGGSPAITGLSQLPLQG